MRGEMDLPEYAIEASGLVKTYPALRGAPAMQALKGIDLKIPRGSIFGLLGPNGAGKSTFINILAGLTKKTSGKVAIWGRDIDQRPRDARAAIGVVPQEIAADFFFTPRESLDVQAGMYGVPKQERITDQLLAALGLADKANAYVRQLSGGMRRRLMVAKAMVHNPPVLILDEPTAGVDVELRRQLWDYVVGLNRRGVTILLTTHYLEEAEQLCDSIAIVNHGQVVACEPTSQLLNHLDTRSVVILPGEPLQAAPTLPPFETRLRPSGELAITFRTHEASVEQVLEAARGAGVHIRDLRTEEPDLEDVFLALTYGADAANIGAP
jgi:ABC-2 type transport system ATP-binding protein